MTSRPDISFDTQGRVSMHLEQNGIAMVLRFSPDVADDIAQRFVVCASHARKVAESLKEAARMEVQSGVRAHDQSTGLGGVSEGTE